MDEKDKDLLKNQEGKYRQKVNLLHILAINPFSKYSKINRDISCSFIGSITTDHSERIEFVQNNAPKVVAGLTMLEKFFDALK